MKPRYSISPEMFEVWDGGHCYIRAKRTPEGHIELYRFPTRASAVDVAKLGEWATKGVKDDSATEGNIVSP